MRTKRPASAPLSGEPRPGDKPSHWKRIAISVFILFHLVAMTAWCLPINSLLDDRFKQAIRPYMLWTGLFHAWDMFAPNPVTLNSSVEAQVTYRDGSVRMWSVPRMNQLGLVNRYFKERYRKYATEYLRLDSYSALWPDAARYIARVNNTNPANPPMMVSLIRSWQDIPPPTPAGRYAPGPWSHFAYFTYPVLPKDLQ